MGYITDARAQIKTKMDAVVGIKGSSARLPEHLPGSPWLVLGTHRADFTPGQRERTDFTFEMRLYVERTPTDDQCLQTAEDIIDQVVQAFSQGITLQGIATAGTTELRLESWTADTWVTIGDVAGGGGTDYLRVDFRLALKVTRTRDYTA